MADQELTDLTEITNPAQTDLVYVVADPGGTPVDRKAQIANLLRAGPRSGYFTFHGGGATGHAPADSTTYFIGAGGVFAPLTTGAIYFPAMPRGGTVTRAYVTVLVAGTLGSAEASTIRVRNTSAATNQNISAALGMSLVNNRVNNTAMTLAFSAGDELSIELVTPAWVTNPTAVFYNITIEVEFTT